MKKTCRKCALKAGPRPLFNVEKQPFSCFMQEILLKIRYFEKRLSKSLKKANFIFFFQSQSLFVDKIMKRGMEIVTNHSSGCKTSSKKFL